MRHHLAFLPLPWLQRLRLLTHHALFLIGEELLCASETEVVSGLGPFKLVLSLCRLEDG